MIAEVRDAFRSGMAEQDAPKVQAMVAEARSGLKELLRGVAERQRLRATPSVPKWYTTTRERRRAWAEQDTSQGASVDLDDRAEDTWAFAELGVSPAATMSEAKLAYHERAKECHPDSGTPSSANEEAFKRLQKAWEHVRKSLLRAQQGSRFR